MGLLSFRTRVFAVVLLVVVIIGTVGFMLTEDLSAWDAFYFTIVTVATVGYGDIHPTTDAGKALALILIIMGVTTFLGVLASATEGIAARRDTKSRMEKLNMVIGAFFSEMGTDLMKRFSMADPDLAGVTTEFRVSGDWAEDDFSRVRKNAKGHGFTIDVERVDLNQLDEWLAAKREFMVRLIENPALMEHELFTEVLWSIFHLSEELGCRDDKTCLPETDMAHLAGDMQRAYRFLAMEWLDYMAYLKKKYPYLFSLAMRRNPFDTQASPIVR